jgi:putative transposase
MLRVAEILIRVVCETLRWLRLSVRSNRSIKAENLFLRRQLALYIERGVKPRRIDVVTRIGLTLLSRCFNWRDALVVVRPATLGAIARHRIGPGSNGVLRGPTQGHDQLLRTSSLSSGPVAPWTSARR